MADAYDGDDGGADGDVHRDDSRSRSRSRDRERDSGSGDGGSGGGGGGGGGSSGGGGGGRGYRPPGDDAKGRKLYVGNLDFRTDESYLKEKFESFGKIEDIFIPRDQDRRSRGFAFITFEDSRDAEDAANDMDRREVDGRPIKCNIAKPRPPMGGGASRGGGGHGGGRGGGGGSYRGRGRPDPAIRVENLPSDVRERELEDLFGKFGRIRDIDIRRGGVAFVDFDYERDAEDAVRRMDG